MPLACATARPRLTCLALLLVACLALSGCGRLVEVQVDVGELSLRARPNQSVVLAADGTRLATLRAENRTDVEWDDLPSILVDAVVAAEDRRFFLHDGVDLRAIARAAVANRRAGEVVEGGSTITQQLVRHRWLPDAPDELGRKVVEAHLAREHERTHSKHDILVEYLNSVYFGAGAHGIAAAAGTYFDTTPAQLDLAQAALLAGLIRSPESASPYGHPGAATALRGRVLEAMVSTGAISASQADAATSRPLDVTPVVHPQTRHPWFVEQVKRSLLADPTFGSTEGERVARLYGGGLAIETTLDAEMQERAAEAAHAVLGRASDPEVGVAVVDPHTGRLVAAVSGRDFTTSQLDLATQSRRQPGSTFKTFALIAALEDGWRLDDELRADPARLRLPDGQTWSVRSGQRGTRTLREATAVSSNGVFARLALELGGPRIAAEARAMGVTSTVGDHPAIVLGGTHTGISPLDLASAYGTLAAGGVHVPVRVVDRIRDADGRTVWTPSTHPVVATDAQTAWLTTAALRDVIEGGTGRAARLDRPAAGKTGTVQGLTDAWFAGYTADLAAAVWVGHPEGQVPMRNVAGFGQVTGSNVPAIIWRRIMTAAHEGRPVRDFRYPQESAVTVLVDPVTGDLATDWCPSSVEITGLPGEVPADVCTLHGPPPPRPVPTPTPTPHPTGSAAPTSPPPTTAPPTTAPPTTEPPTTSPPTTPPTSQPSRSEPPATEATPLQTPDPTPSTSAPAARATAPD